MNFNLHLIFAMGDLFIGEIYAGWFVRWTIHDSFIHINSFMKNKQNSDLGSGHLVHQFLLFFIIFLSGLRYYMYENVTYGPSQVCTLLNVEDRAGKGICLCVKNIYISDIYFTLG